ncbi:MAG: hypothetical protein JNM93_09060 [Bacteriovoracaceae bacterium]|nr:hypothetical protein [Bacteriovoracaceae bacterium]
MFSRKEHDINEGIDIPAEWQEEIVIILNQTFEAECVAQNKSFDLYGKIYNDELLIVASWVDNSDTSVLPVSCFLSVDITKETKTDKILDVLVDLAGAFFDEYFSNKDWDDFEPNWQETKHKKDVIYYKVTRENVALSLEAENILKEDIRKNQ